MKITARLIAMVGFVGLASIGLTFADTTRTLAGEYVSSFESGMQPLQAEFRGAGEGRWDVVFHFKFHGKNHTYEGFAEGSLDEGKLQGQVQNENGRRTFTFQGNFSDGEFRGTHAEIKRTGERRTGSLTLSETG